MCGIFGIIHQKNEPVPKEEVHRATDLLAHRGPDAAAYFVKSCFGMGHRRLSIIDLSEKGTQPMHREGYTIIHNGEVYNYIEIRALLREKGYTFSSQTDTEVILAAYMEWGEECIQRFNGMWAFCIYDPKKKIFFCSRDRYGIKPFYYTRIGDTFCLASEIKAFTAVSGWKATVNPVRAWEFLVRGYHDHTSETLFKDVFHLPPGNNLVYDLSGHTFRLNKYYHFPEASVLSCSFEEAKHKFKNLFFDAISLRLRADVPIGTALSGGLDSSSLALAMNQLLPENAVQESITACFEDTRFDERPFAQAAARRAGIKIHKVFPQREELEEAYHQLLWQQEEPIAGAGVWAQYKVFETAREKGLTVMLNGQGADEILGGYEKFYAPYFKWLFRKRPFLGIYELIHFFFLHSISPWQALKAVFAFRKKQLPLHPEWINLDINPEKPFSRTPDSSMYQCSLNLFREVGLPTLLHYEDRNSMAFSIESRLPFLDYRLVEFCLSIPDTFKIHRAKRKYLLRESMKDLLPQKIYTRYDKMGFATPQRIWLKTEDAHYKKQLRKAIHLSNGILNNKLFDHYHQQDLIWRAISFGKWMEVFEVEGPRI